METVGVLKVCLQQGLVVSAEGKLRISTAKDHATGQGDSSQQCCGVRSQPPQPCGCLQLQLRHSVPAWTTVLTAWRLGWGRCGTWGWPSLCADVLFQPIRSSIPTELPHAGAGAVSSVPTALLLAGVVGQDGVPGAVLPALIGTLTVLTTPGASSSLGAVSNLLRHVAFSGFAARFVRSLKKVFQMFPVS